MILNKQNQPRYIWYNECNQHLPIMWMAKEANTTTQPQPPSGGGGWRLLSASSCVLSSLVAPRVRLLGVAACVISLCAAKSTHQLRVHS